MFPFFVWVNEITSLHRTQVRTSIFDDRSLTRTSDSRSSNPQQLSLCTGGRVSPRRPQRLPEGNSQSHPGRDRTLVKGLQQTTRLLAQWVGGNREEYNRTNDRGEVIRRRTARCLLLLLTRLRGPAQPQLHLPHPSCPTRTEVHQISVNPYSACAARSESCIRVPVQPDEQTNRRASQEIFHLYPYRH